MDKNQYLTENIKNIPKKDLLKPNTKQSHSRHLLFLKIV